jgi:hypothetical protein
MQIHSLKLTFQDIVTKDGAKIAAVLGTLYIDDGKMVANKETLKPEPEYEKINFTTALSNNLKLKTVIQEMIVEALTLKNLQLAKENGNLTHFVEAMGVNTRPVPRKRVSKIRRKK